MSCRQVSVCEATCDFLQRAMKAGQASLAPLLPDIVNVLGNLLQPVPTPPPLETLAVCVEVFGRTNGCEVEVSLNVWF